MGTCRGDREAGSMWRPLAIGLGAVVALGASRAWLRDWGATPDEAGSTLAGDAVVPDAADQTTRAITVDAPPGRVWPWLAQIGHGRGGFYSYASVERLLGIPGGNLERVDPALAALRVGEVVRMTPDPYLRWLPGQQYVVVDVDPPRSLVLLERRPSGEQMSWAFVLRPLPDGRTRLIARARRAGRASPARRVAQWLELTLVGPGFAIMERGMLRGLANRAQRGEDRVE